MRTPVDGSRLKVNGPVSAAQIFEQSAEYIYRWVVQKYAPLFHSMPQEVSSYRADMMAYHVMIQYDRAQLRMHMHVRHMDMEVGGRIWYSEACLEADESEQIWLKLCNGYAEPERENRPTPESGGVFFSYPGYYKEIVGNVGIRNGIECLNKRRILKDAQIPDLMAALEDPDRLFPIVLIVSKENEDGMMDEEWLGQFRVSDFTRAVWRYAHVLTSYEETGRQLLTQAGLTEITVPQIYVFWPDGRRDSYGPEDIRNCSFGRHLENRDDDRTYDIVRGGQAFYHRLVTELRDWNMSAQIWEGFKMEDMKGCNYFEDNVSYQTALP
jgi:hypothetical protein